MNNSKAKIIYSLLFILAATLPVSCFKSLTTTNIVYENNFENGNRNTLDVSAWNNSGSFGPVNDLRIINYNGTKVLGQLNNSVVQLNLVNLPSHQILRVELDLYLHNQWKNDLWIMSFNGVNRLLTGFSNDSTVLQSYPNWFGNGSSLSPAGADASNLNLPGTCNPVNISSWGTSKYRIIQTIAHSEKNFVLNFSDAGGTANDTCRRSWSIDNLKVSVFRN